MQLIKNNKQGSAINQLGFTMIEIIVTLALLGIIGVFGTMFMLDIVQSYRFADQAAHTSQKAQVTLTRISNEMAYADTTPSISGNTLDYTVSYSGSNTVHDNRITSSGSLVQLEKDGSISTLTDQVHAFEVSTNSDYFTIQLTLQGPNDTTSTYSRDYPF